jgi:glycosyltransferase involved in cell wall biosynthesis
MSLKVLHLIDSGGLYGAENMLLDLVSEQLRQGMEPLILSAGIPGIGEKPLERAARARGLPVRPFRMCAGLNFRKGLELLGVARREGFDVLHSHGYKFNILLGFVPRTIRKIPLITTLHGYVHASPFSKMWFNHRLDHLSLGRMDAVVCVSEATMKSARLSGKHATVINNGIDMSVASGPGEIAGRPAVCKEPPAEGFLIAAFGRLTSEKGFNNLITAFAQLAEKLPEAKLTVWGDGYLRDDLELLVSRNNLSSRVSLPGYTDQVETFLPMVDLLVIPSHTEGLPLILLEAIKSRVPVVASAVGAIPEVLDGGKCGILVSPGSVDEIMEAVSNVYHDREAAKARAGLALRRAEELYSSCVMAESYRDLYMELQGGRE